MSARSSNGRIFGENMPTSTYAFVRTWAPVMVISRAGRLAVDREGGGGAIWAAALVRQATKRVARVAAASAGRAIL